MANYEIDYKDKDLRNIASANGVAHHQGESDEKLRDRIIDKLKKERNNAWYYRK